MVLTQTHPAAPYVCRTVNITLRCQYDGVEGVLNVVWNVDDVVNLDFDSMTLPGHTALDRTGSHQDLVIASFADLPTYHLVLMQWLVQVVKVQWSSLRPTQLPLMCVELATSPSGVSMMELWEWPLWCGSLGLRQGHSTHPSSQDTLPSLAPPPIRR